MYVQDASQMGIKAEDLLRPFEQARYFQPPLDLEHGLSEPHEYEHRISDLKHNIEHLESLRDSANVAENVIA